MNFVFFGSPEFAAIVLQKLIDANFIPKVLVCNPDRPVGRKRIVTPPLTKQIAKGKEQIVILQPEKLDENFIDSLSKISDSYDFFIVAAYSKIIRKQVLDIPKLGTIGVHPSLLPEYRGSSPIQGVILNQEKTTGTTLFLIDEKVDHGEILTSSKLQIADGDTFVTLRDKLANLAGDLLIKTLPKFIKGEIKPIPQDESKATLTKKFSTQDGFINLHELSAAENGDLEMTKKINAKIRALHLEPGVWTTKENRRMKLLESKIENEKLIIKKYQFEGERPKSI